MTTHTMNTTRTRRRPGLLAGVLSAFVLVGVLFGAAALADPGDPPDPALAEHDVGAWANDVPVTPAGMTPVSGPEGNIVGFLRNADTDQALANDGPPDLDLDAGQVTLRGFEVVDPEGALVGYFLSGEAGFVSLAEAHDPQALDAIASTWEAEQAASQGAPPPDVAELDHELDDAARGPS